MKIHRVNKMIIIGFDCGLRYVPMRIERKLPKPKAKSKNLLVHSWWGSKFTGRWHPHTVELNLLILVSILTKKYDFIEKKIFWKALLSCPELRLTRLTVCRLGIYAKSQIIIPKKTFHAISAKPSEPSEREVLFLLDDREPLKHLLFISWMCHESTLLAVHCFYLFRSMGLGIYAIESEAYGFLAVPFDR